MYKELTELAESRLYPFHMPGHKRRMKGTFDPYKLDITEIDGFDNMHCPSGMIMDLNRALNEYFGGDESRILINGSTSGVLTAISAVTEPGDKILLAGNSHKSAYDAVYLRGLEAVSIYPEEVGVPGISGGIRPENVREILKRDPSVRAVFLTSPSYEGFLSDVQGIAEVCHEKGLPLITDSAHGAHAGLYKGFTDEFSFVNAADTAADMIVKSLHKNLPAFTQTAMITRNGNLVDQAKFDRFYSAYQSTSPSYILMAGADRMLEFLKAEGEESFRKLELELKDLRKTAEDTRNTEIIGPEFIGKYGVYGFDPTKILITHKDLSGKELYDVLRKKYLLQPEMTKGKAVLMMTSLMDTEEGFSRLKEALKDLA